MCIASSRRSRCGRTAWFARPGRSRRRRRRCGCSRTASAPTDEVAIEATCNTHAIVRLIEPRVARVVVSNPQKTRAIAEAKVKTDKVDAQVLAQLLAADYLPAVWVADEADAGVAPAGRAARAHRPSAHAAEEPGAVDPASQPGPALPGRGPVRDQGPLLARRASTLPPDEELAVEALLRQLDFHGQELRIIDAALGRIALAQRRGQAADDDPRRRRDRRAVDRRRGRRLPPVPQPGAAGLLSRAEPAGASSPAASPPRMGGSPSRVARTRAGCSSRPRGSRSRPRAVARVLSSASAPGAGCRSRSSRPPANSPCLCWHLVIKRRGLRVRAPVADREEAPRARAPRRACPSHRGEKGTAAAYSLKEVRRRERELAEQAEHAYRQLVADWQANAPGERWAWPPPMGRD